MAYVCLYYVLDTSNQYIYVRKEEFKTVAGDLLALPLLNHHQTSQTPGAPT